MDGGRFFRHAQPPDLKTPAPPGRFRLRPGCRRILSHPAPHRTNFHHHANRAGKIQHGNGYPARRNEPLGRYLLFQRRRACQCEGIVPPARYLRPAVHFQLRAGNALLLVVLGKPRLLYELREEHPTVTKRDIAEFVDKYIKGKKYVLGVSSSQENLSTLNLNKADLLQW